MSFVGTSFFSVPVEQPSLDATTTTAPTEVSKLLQQALASLESISQQNAQLVEEKKQLHDRLALLASTTTAAEGGGELSDASIGMLRGKLVQESRQENRALHDRLVRSESLLLACKHSLYMEQMANAQLAQHAKPLQQALRDCEALSNARAKAVDRLDSDLVQCRQTKELAEQELKELRRVHDGECADVRQALHREREHTRRLQDRLLEQGLDIRVLQAEYAPPPSSSSASSLRWRSGDDSTTPKQQPQHQAEHHLRRQVADLEQEVIRLRQQSAAAAARPQLKQSLASLVSELKRCTEESTRERARLNGYVCALTCKCLALQRQLVKVVRRAHEYKRQCKSAQAELASFVAKRVGLFQ